MIQQNIFDSAIIITMDIITNQFYNNQYKFN